MEYMKMPESLDDMVDMADQLVERYLKTQSPLDLLGCVLAVSHIADWYYHSREELNKQKLKEFLKDFSSTYPEWNTIRQLGNGLKHAEVRPGQAHHNHLELRDYEWEDADAWSHLGTSRKPWYVRHKGRDRTVDGLCKFFLESFKINEMKRDSG